MDSVKALDLEQRSLGLFRYITLVAHAGSIIMAIIALNNIDSQVTSVTNTTTNVTTVSGEFPRHDLIVEFKNSDGSVEKTTKTIESLNTLWMQCINDIVVLVTALILLARDTNLIDEDQTFYENRFFSLLHILSYGFTSITSAIMFYIYFSGDQFWIAVIIGGLVLTYEAAKHYTEVMVQTNAKRSLGMISVVVIILELILLIIAQQNNSRKNTGGLLAAMIVALVVKAAHEFAHNMDYPTFYVENSDRRHGHVIMDLAIKGGLAWSIILREMNDSGSVLTVDESTGWADAMPIVTIILAALGMGISLLPQLKRDQRNNLQAPSGTMEEKSRMLQVA